MSDPYILSLRCLQYITIFSRMCEQSFNFYVENNKFFLGIPF